MKARGFRQLSVPSKICSAVHFLCSFIHPAPFLPSREEQQAATTDVSNFIRHFILIHRALLPS